MLFIYAFLHRPEPYYAPVTLPLVLLCVMDRTTSYKLLGLACCETNNDSDYNLLHIKGFLDKKQGNKK
jgi:hypothetical protein